MTIVQQGTARQLYIAKPTGLLNSFRLKSGLTDVQLATHLPILISTGSYQPLLNS